MSDIASRMAINVTIATRERSARREIHNQAIAACQRVAQEKRRAKKIAESNGALACIEAVRALLPEVS